LDEIEIRLRELLADLAEAHRLLQKFEHDLTHFAHETGMSWERIGECHDPPISRQRARQRYDKPKPRRERSG
jgi:hypothetical protein